jgi:hypothetical protein
MSNGDRDVRNGLGGHQLLGNEAGAYSQIQRRMMREAGRGGILDKALAVSIGRKARIGPSTSPFPQRIDLIAPQAANFSEPLKICCDLNVTVLPGLVELATAHLVRIQLQWGTGGGLQEAEIDAKHGTQFSICASSLVVSAIYLEGAEPLGPSYEISISACLGSGTTWRGGVTLTFLQEVVAAGAELVADILIPSHATHVCWYSRTDPAGFAVPACVIEQKDAAAADVALSLVPSLEWVPIVQSADLCNVLNTAADAEFGLMFAILL